MGKRISGRNCGGCGGDEAVSTLGNGLNVPGIFSIVSESISEFANRNAQAAVKVDEGVSLPDASLNFLTAHHVPGILQEYDQKTERLLLELHPPSLLQKLTGHSIHFEGAEFVSSPRRSFHGPSLNNRTSLRHRRMALVLNELLVHK
jgi:hypothetical protein